MRGFQCLWIFLGMFMLFPVVFGIASWLWNINYLAALIAVFVGISIDLLGGFELIDRTLSQA